MQIVTLGRDGKDSNSPTACWGIGRFNLTQVVAEMLSRQPDFRKFMNQKDASRGTRLNAQSVCGFSLSA
jgi:hypothetical protein